MLNSGMSTESFVAECSSCCRLDILSGGMNDWHLSVKPGWSKLWIWYFCMNLLWTEFCLLVCLKCSIKSNNNKKNGFVEQNQYCSSKRPESTAPLLHLFLFHFWNKKSTRKTSLVLEVNEQVERSKVLYLFWFGEEQLWAGGRRSWTQPLLRELLQLFGLKSSQSKTGMMFFC